MPYTLTAPAAQPQIGSYDNVRFQGDQNQPIVWVYADAFDTNGKPLPTNPQRGTLTPAQFQSIVAGAATWHAGMFALAQAALGLTAGTVT